MPGILPEPEGPSPKVYVTSGPLPPYISPSEAPTKKAPWRTVRSVEFVQTVTATLPEELYDIIWREVGTPIADAEYAQVIMKLEDVLQGEFFNEYIKIGNILMLTEGKPGVDEVFFLSHGVLRLELSQEVYKRAGLQGVPIRSGGRKHVKSRYAVEYNLRLPSMLRGKKGFDKLVWAAKNVLNRSLCWLFIDLNSNKDPEKLQRPITTHHPTTQSLSPTIQTLRDVRFPWTLTTPLSSTLPGTKPAEETQESIHDLFEFVDLLAVASPRVQTTDNLDPFLSRYQVPDLLESDSETRGTSVKVVTWTGLVSARWILELLCAIIKQSRAQDLSRLDRTSQWLGLSVTAHRTEPLGQIEGYTVLLQPEAETNHSSIANNDGVAIIKDNTSDHKTVEDRPQGRRDDAAQQVDVQMMGDTSTTDKDAVKTRTGFQRYICVEHVDSLT